MVQQSFNFGPSHNVRDPNTSTASNSGIDDIVSKLSSLLSGNSNNNQLELSLKNAVKEGIIEAKKEDVRVDDSEERGEERRHKELMQHLNRIAALGTHHPNSYTNTKEEKKEDGIGIVDVLKWGAVAGTIATLIGNLDSLGNMFDNTTKGVIKFKNDVEGYIADADKFSERMGKLVNETFTKDGAIGLLLGAFSPGGLLTKTILGFIGSVTGGQIGKKLNEYGINSDSVNMGGMAGGLAAMRIGGGGLFARALKFGGGYLAGEHATSQFSGEKSIFDRIANGDYSLDSGLYDENGNVSKEGVQGLGLAGAAVYFGKKVLPNMGGKAKGVALGALGLGAYNYANDNISLLPDFNLPDMSSILGEETDSEKKIKDINIEQEKIKQQIKDNRYGGLSVEEFGKLPLAEQNKKGKEIKGKREEFEKKLEELTAAKEKIIKDLEAANDPYDAKIKEYDEELKQLKAEQIRIENYRSLPYEEKNKARETYKEDQQRVRQKISSVETEKQKFIIDNKSASIAPLQELLKNSGVATDVNAGKGEYFGESARDAAAIGGAFGVFGGLPGIAAGAVMGVAMDSAMEALVTRVERYIIDELKSPPISLLDLAIQQPETALKVLSKFAEDHTLEASALFGLVAFTVFTPGSSAKVLQGILKNIPKLGVVTTKTVSGTTVVFNKNILQGVTKSAAKVGVAAGVGAAVPFIMNNNNDITSVLNTPNSNLPSSSIHQQSIPSNDTPSIPSVLPSNDVVSNNPSHSSLAGDNRTFANGKFVDDGLTTIITTKKGTKVEVAKSRAANFEGFLNDLETSGYDIKTIKGLSNRHGSKDLPDSTHNMGIAIDINAGKNQQASKEGGPRMTDMNPELVRNLAKKYDLEWGGDYGRPDAMHFTVDKAKRTPEEDQKNIRNSIFAKRAMGINGDNSPNFSNNPYGDLVGQLLRTESRGDPDAYYGDSTGKYKHLLGGKTVSTMTLNELEQFQKKLTSATKGTLKDTDKGTSAAGIGQWVGSTLFGEGYNNKGFLTEYFGTENYDKNRVFDKDLQKDMLKQFMLSDNYGKFGEFMKGEGGSVEEYAQHLGKQWQGLSKPEEQKRLIQTLNKIKSTPGLDPEKALGEVIGKMESLSLKSGDFGKTIDEVGKKLGEGFDKLGDFLKNITEQASGLLPQDLKNLIDIPAIGEFFSPLFGGESRSTLAHPKKTFTSQEQAEIKSLLMGTSSSIYTSAYKEHENLPIKDNTVKKPDKTTLSVEPNIALDGSIIAQQSSKLEKDKLNAQASGIGNVINMAAGGGETIHGQPIAGLHGNVNTHFPGDIDAISATIYKWTDAPMFYAAGKMG